MPGRHSSRSAHRQETTPTPPPRPRSATISHERMRTYQERGATSEQLLELAGIAVRELDGNGLSGLELKDVFVFLVQSRGIADAAWHEFDGKVTTLARKLAGQRTTTREEKQWFYRLCSSHPEAAIAFC